MEQRKERRQRRRFLFHYKYQTGPGEVDSNQATVVDVSDRGVRFETREKLHVGTRLKLYFDPESSLSRNLPSEREGIVVWSIQPDPEVPHYLAGLKYL